MCFLSLHFLPNTIILGPWLGLMPIEIVDLAMITFSIEAAELDVKLANPIANRMIRFLAFMV